MPIEAGLFRRYEAQNLNGGYVGKVELHFCDDDNGVRKILESKTGIRSPRKTFSELDWDDNAIQLANEYHDGGSGLKDASAIMERVEKLADTPYRKLYTAAAIDCMKRIFEGDVRYTNNGKFSGHWNFFSPRDIIIENGKIKISEYDGTYSFEWKNIKHDHDGCYSLLGSDVLEFLNYAADYVWNDEWRIGASYQVISESWLSATTDIAVESAGVVETAAGRFEDCLKIALDIKSNQGSGYDHLVGKKDYYLAPKIGIVKLVNHFKDGKLQAIFELTAYDGTGEGYMPVNPGLFRRYEAIGLTGGYVGKAEYNFCEDESGQLKVIENRTGIRMFDVALAEYNQKIDADPQNAELWESRSFFKREIRQWDDALSDCDRAIELDATNALFFIRRGWIHYELGNYDKSIEDYNHFMEMDATNQHAYHERSLVLWKLEKYTDAVRDYKKSVELEPKRTQWSEKQIIDWKKELEEKGIDVSAVFDGE
jgi:tetratricopeptide (TPR) repeat protein